MGLRDQYPVTYTLDRLVQTGDKESYVTQAGTLKGHLQPASGEMVALTDGDFSKSFSLFTDVNQDILVADRITIDSKLYYVKSIKNFNIGTLQHKEIIIELSNNDG